MTHQTSWLESTGEEAELTSPGEGGEASDRVGHLKAQASCTHCSCCSCRMAGFTLDTLSVLTVARDLIHS